MPNACPLPSHRFHAAVQNGYSIEDLVALSGSHSIGFHAGGKTPMTKNPLAFNGGARHTWRCAAGRPPVSCGAAQRDPHQPALPPGPHHTPLLAEYFQLVLGGKAAFKSDNVLAAPGALPQSRQLVQLYAGNLPAFHAAFARSYIKMASMGARWRSYGAKLLA